MAQGPSDTILMAIRITLRIRESKVRNPDIGGGLCSLSASSLLFVTYNFCSVPDTRLIKGNRVCCKPA